MPKLFVAKPEPVPLSESLFLVEIRAMKICRSWWMIFPRFRFSFLISVWNCSSNHLVVQRKIQIKNENLFVSSAVKRFNSQFLGFDMLRMWYFKHVPALQLFLWMSRRNWILRSFGVESQRKYFTDLGLCNDGKVRHEQCQSRFREMQPSQVSL